MDASLKRACLKPLFLWEKKLEAVTCAAAAGCVSKSGLYSFKTAAEMREKLLFLFICVPLPLGPLPHDCCILLQPTDLLSQMSTSFMTASAFGGGPFTR